MTLRELQLTELVILEKFDGFCKARGLKYTLCGGTLLGAVRHKGFIPWDDDLHGKKSFLYLSSVEVYGENYDETKRLDEQTLGAVDSLSVRSSYTESKRLAETLCMSYAQQYGLSVKIARLSQILGVVEGDTRLIAYMCDCARQKQSIALKSDGKATKAYCYIADSVAALLHILADGENTAYNVANKDMVFSVYELAKFVSERYKLGEVVVENKTETIYPKSSYLVMDATRSYALGWRPRRRDRRKLRQIDRGERKITGWKGKKI